MKAKATDRRPAHVDADKANASSTHPTVRVLKAASCRSLSGRSTIGYEVGATADNEIHLRVTGNSGQGCFGRDWVALRAVQRELAKASGPVTSSTLRRAFAGKSANTGGFVSAALLNEGLLEPMANARGYAPTDGVEFMRRAKQLLERGPARDTAEGAARSAEAPAPRQQRADAPKPLARKAAPASRAKAARR